MLPGMPVPFGFVTSIVVFALLTALALRPPRPRHANPWSPTVALTYLLNEQPFLAAYLLAASTLPVLAGDVGTPGWWLGVALTACPAAGLVALAVRARTARPALTAALDRAFGPAPVRRHRLPLLRILLFPFVSYRVDVRRVRNLRYGDAGRGHLLDVYHGRSRRRGSPVLVYLHGGGLRIGNKMIGGRPLLYRLASRGWVCVSANYRLGHHARYADQLDDVRRALHWVREHATEYGADPGTVFLAGGSAGAHLATTAALTDPAVAGVIGLYGYYGAGVSPAPADLLHAGAPPFLVVHGALDTAVPARDARRFAAELGRASARPVAYAELPGTQHNFDFFHSLRCHAVLDAVERFADQVRGYRP